MANLIEIPADLWQMYHDDPIVAKYRLLLGRLVYQVLTAPKRDRKAIIARKEQVQRQIRGRQIKLLKSGVVPKGMEPVTDIVSYDPTLAEPEVWVPMTFTSEAFLTTKRNRI
jgi:hypothetical protein